MADRAQSFRASYRAGSFVQITTGIGQISGEIVTITDDFIVLKIAASTQPILIDVNEAKIILPISHPAEKQSHSAPHTAQSALPGRGPRSSHHRQSSTNIPSDKTLAQLFNEAQAHLRRNDYSNAIKIARQILGVDPQYPGAAALLERSQEIERSKKNPDRTASELPPQQASTRKVERKEPPRLNRSSKYFALALQASSDEEAIQYLYRSIEQRESKTTSAIKDLANRLAGLGRGEEAIRVLQQNRNLIRDQQSVDNLLIHIYIKLKQYEEAVTLLKKKNDATPSSRKSLETLKKIADCYIKLEKYKNAIPYLNEIVSLTSDTREGLADHKPTLKRLALCYMQERNYGKSEQILQNLLITSPDDEQLLELQKTLQEVRQTGQLDENITSKLFSDTSNEVGGFARFMLKYCEFRGVPPGRLQEKIQEKKFDPSDLDRLQRMITGAIYADNYNDCAEFYLSAASIVSLQDWTDKNDIYKYLFLSFASRGDASLKKKSLDTVREWYCEALHNYDKIPHRKSDEKEVIKCVTKFLYSIVGEEAVPLLHTNHAIEYVLKDVFERNQQTTGELLNTLTHLTSRSKRARQLILTGIVAQPGVYTTVIRYIATTFGLQINPQDLTISRFTELWNLLDKKSRSTREQVYEDLRWLEKFEIKPSLAEDIEHQVKHFHDLKSLLSLQLDRDRIATICAILDLVPRFFKESGFEQREYFCERIDAYCRELLEKIKAEPTRFSVERLYYPVEAIQKKVKAILDELYITSEPHLTLALAQKHWVPDVHSNITLQINVANGQYCSPAEAVELYIPERSTPLFTVKDAKVPLESGPSLPGGEEGTFFVPIHLTAEAINQEAFSLRVLVHHHTRLKKPAPPFEALFSIHLEKEAFEKINPNPYAPHVGGLPVTDPKMFLGRDEFIEKIAHTLMHTRGKAIVIYGQKRVGKSSIRLHLKKRLEREAHLLVADVESMANITPDERASSFSQVLWKILYAIKKTLLMKNAESRELLHHIPFPKESTIFFDHPSPLTYFQEILDILHLVTQTTPGWEHTRIILLFDEFQHLYQLIQAGKLDAQFMVHWKALLERNLFNTVLVGQNGMSRFRDDYPNEFDAMQHEPVSYLEEKDAKDLIENPIRLKDGRSRYREAAVKRILDLTAGSPYYIQIFCYYLVEHMNREQRKTATEATIEEVVHNLLSGKKATFITIDNFDNLITSGDPSENEEYWQDAVEIMACIAKKSRGAPCPKEAIDCQIEPGRVQRILENYVRTGVLQRDGDKYRLYVGLFQQWLILHR
jgi:tetratricopeptide (TPR) repeat protein/AAA+ ATPase superfamily predicted ATPase